MTCVGRAPNSIDEWTAIIERCATAAGGANWAQQAILGAQALALLVVVVLVVAVLIRRA